MAGAGWAILASATRRRSIEQVVPGADVRIRLGRIGKRRGGFGTLGRTAEGVQAGDYLSLHCNARFVLSERLIDS